MNKASLKNSFYCLVCGVCLALLTSCSGFQWSDQSQYKSDKPVGRSYTTERLDNALEKRISKQLVQLHPNFGNRTKVLCVNGVVLMVGSIDNESLAQQASAIAEQHKEVRLVYNRIKVRSSQQAEATWNDRWIISKLRTAFIFNEHIPADNISVHVYQNTVYLMGLVTPKQAELATTVARKVRGVSKVVSAFEHAY